MKRTRVAIAALGILGIVLIIGLLGWNPGVPISLPLEHAQSPAMQPVSHPPEPTLAPPQEHLAVTVPSQSNSQRQVIFVTVEAEQTGSP